MTGLFLSLILAASGLYPTLKAAEDSCTARLRGCYVEKRLNSTASKDVYFTLWRCGGPPSEPKSYQVGFVITRMSDDTWFPDRTPFIETP
jgi:hypothetical protein